MSSGSFGARKVHLVDCYRYHVRVLVRCVLLCGYLLYTSVVSAGIELQRTVLDNRNIQLERRPHLALLFSRALTLTPQVAEAGISVTLRETA